MGYERFNRIATGVQALVVAVAVVVGGGWALYRFESLEEIERARAELEQVRRELRERGVLNLTLRVATLDATGDRARLVRVEVGVENVGDRSELIEWAKSGLSISRVAIAEGALPAYEAVALFGYGSPYDGALSSTVLPGQTRTFEFLAALEAGGVHQFRFVAAASPAEAEESLREHGQLNQEDVTISWQVMTFARVE